MKNAPFVIQKQAKHIERLEGLLSKYRINELKPLYDSLIPYLNQRVYFKNQLLGFDVWDKNCTTECTSVVVDLEILPNGVKITLSNDKTNIIRLEDKYTIFTLQP